MKIVIAGGTGFIGQYLCKRFKEKGEDVIIISRNNGDVNWNDEEALLNAVEACDCLINLAGKSVDCRYNDANKKLILESRVTTTNKLQEVVNKCKLPPKIWINSSTATIYRHSQDRVMDEYDGEVGSGFSVEVAKAWEAAFFKIENKVTRKVALRISIVLGKNGGVMKPYKNLVRYGFGGKQGIGMQMFSWIHIEDLFRIMCFVITNKEMNGVYNAASPNPVTNNHLMKAFRNQLKPIFYLNSPTLLLKIGASIINTETELILKSRWVIPRKLLEKGFVFKYDTIEKTLENLL